MSRRDVARRPRGDHNDLDQHRLQERFRSVDATPIAAMPSRGQARVVGEVTRMQTAPRSGVPALEVVLGDGTGTVIAIFTGRRSIPGIVHGRAMIVEGVAHDERGRRVLFNPAYTLLAI